ncbi:hypothetical protein Trydic_g12371 [Trypoxylus dichotomus]
MSKFIILVPFLTACATALLTQSSAGKGTDHDFRVVGGTDAADGAYPFMVSLRTSSNIHFCGGTILNTRWILTAGHCMIGKDTSDVVAVVGTNTLKSKGIIRRTCKIVIHPNYNDTNFSNDIAVIMVTTPFTFNGTIASVVIITGFPPPILNVTVIGWGRTNGGAAPIRLQEFSTQTISRSLCSPFYKETIKPNCVCTKMRKGKGICNGDSGSPLLHTESKAQLGISSFNNREGCNTDLVLLDVYTKVAPYAGWMRETLRSPKLTCSL